jgi:hypothetical protein
MPIGNFLAFSFFMILGFQMSKCIGPLVLETPKVSNVEMPMVAFLSGISPKA